MTSDSVSPDTSPVVKSEGFGAKDVVLDINDVSKSFVTSHRRVQALERVSLRIGRGLVTGLIGPDGAGKTTLMRLVTGLLLADGGRISVFGVDVAREPLVVQAMVGYMPQRFGLYEDLTVQENLDLYADLQGVVPADRPARYRELMRMTGLAPFTTRLAGRLSGGMKQKLGLACTLVRSPAVLLLDEPTVGVDPVSRRELWAIVYRLVQEQAMTVLLSTAYLEEAERCHEVALLYQGQVLGQDSPASFSAQLQGRTYAVTAPGLKKRALQETLSVRPGVVDAVIQGDRVRLVMDNTTPPATDALLPALPNAVLEPVPPRFEDSFIARLRAGETTRASAYSTDQHYARAVASPTGNEPVIEVRHVQRRFGSFYAVRDITFDVCRGEVFGLLGANGAGKSTTFRMLCGLLPPTNGSLRVAGVNLRRAAAHARARIGYMSQRFSLYGSLSALQNLEFFSSAYGLSGSQREARIAWALRQFELERVADVSSIDLPLGYKQRLALACALMHEPEILFLDEPTSGVDPLARREFWRRINLLAERGVTVLITTHFMEEAEYCDRLAIMAAGEILSLGTPAEIKRAARSPVIAEPTMEQAFIALIEAQQQTGMAS
jgi:ABC-2 type transport system ATP-binding protein